MKPLIDRLHERFASKEINGFDVIPDVDEWNSFLNSLPEPKDCFDAAYNKYKCRMHYFSCSKKLLMNLLGLGAVPVVLFYAAISNKKISKMTSGKAILEKGRDVDHFDDIFPNELYDEYDVTVVDNFNKKFGVLCREAKSLFWKNVKRHPFEFFYNYFVYMELAAHSFFLLTYNPEATIVYVNERNVASPIITELYESDGREFISFMHGEYLLQLVQGYMTFSRYYIWDKAYEKMFNWLRCGIHRYCVYTPGKLTKKWDFSDTVPEYFLTYYLSNQSKESIMKLGELLEQFENSGKKCKVRPHPRDVLHTKEIFKTFKSIEIEDSVRVSLKESFANTEYVVGINSTVLSEAYVEGKKVVLDDISDSEHFTDAKIRGSVVFEREHSLLSELYNKNETI